MRCSDPVDHNLILSFIGVPINKWGEREYWEKYKMTLGARPMRLNCHDQDNECYAIILA